MKKVIAMGRKPRGVRLDSGDLTADSIWLRKTLDDAGWGDVEILASGDLDEERIASLLADGARINTFGVGTALSTSWDAPSLGMLYKLVELERDGEVHGAAKFSAAKVTYPGRKQVYRSADAQGNYAGDMIAVEEEVSPSGHPLLVPVMRSGRRLGPPEQLIEAQKRCRAQMQCIPPGLRELGPAHEPYPVHHSARLQELRRALQDRVARNSST